MSKSKPGQKFVHKYSGLSTANIYKGDPACLRIPGPDHPLYDPSAPTTFDEWRVRAIDRDGKMTTPIEVFTDPDSGILWVLDGRGRLLDVREVNRRRAAEGCELVEPYIVPFPGDEKAAIARLYEKNYHRRGPSPSGMAVGIRDMRKKGHSWEACAAALHQETDNAEQWCKSLLPLAYCAPEVQTAVDAGTIPRSAARRFGGAKADGSEALGPRAQIELLGLLTSQKNEEKRGDSPRAITPKARARVRAALGNGETDKLRAADKAAARLAAAVLARVDGDAGALTAWPEVEAIFEGALASKKEQ